MYDAGMQIPEEYLMMWDQPVIAGVRTSPRMDANLWTRALRDHADHAEFAMEDWPYERFIGFSCACRGEDDEELWSMPLTEMRRLHRDVRNFYEAVRARTWVPGNPQNERRNERNQRLFSTMEEADRKAMELLVRHLTEEQRLEVAARKCFHMRAGDGRTYRIENGSAHNVVLVDEAGDAMRYCVVFGRHDRLPNADLMLAQKLFLEADPEAFLKMARRQDLRRPDMTCAVVIEEVPGAGPQPYEMPAGFRLEAGEDGVQQVVRAVEEGGVRHIARADGVRHIARADGVRRAG